MPSIYLVRLNGEPKYVGYTKRTLKQRWKHHCQDARNGSMTLLHVAIRNNPLESFTIETIHEGDDPLHVLSVKEPQLIAEWNTHWSKGGFNMNGGGKGNHEVSEITRSRMSIAKKGKRKSDETRRKMSEAKRGSKLKPQTKEHKKKISDSTKGRVVSEETKRRMSASQRRRRMLIPNIMESVRQFRTFRYCDGDF